MAHNVEMKTLTMKSPEGENTTFEIVDEQARNDITMLEGKVDGFSIPSEYVTMEELEEKGYASQTEVTNHKDDSTSHVTATEKQTWNNKSNFSGSYNDLTNKPTIPDKTSQLTNDSGFLTSVPSEYVTETELIAKEYATQSAVDTLSAEVGEKQPKGDYALKNELPTKTSQLTNDSGFLTSVPSEYVTETELTAKNYLTSVPSEYVTETELEAQKYVKQSSLESHTADSVSHITSAERTAWNGKAGPEDIPTKYSELTDDVGYVKEKDFNSHIHLWTDIANKPFEKTTGKTLSWNGDTAGLANIGNADFKIYDEVPTVEEASEGGYFKYEDGGEIKTFTFTTANIDSWNDDIFAVYGDAFGEIVVVSKDGASYSNLNNLEKGIYISSYSGKYISEIMFNGYDFTNHILKEQALPKHEHLWRDIKNALFGEVKTSNGDTVVSDKTVYGNYHKVSDAVPKRADINKGLQLTYHWVENGKLSKASRTFDSTDQYYSISENTAGIIITYDGTPLVVISFTGSSTIGGWRFEGITEAGTYFRQDSYYCTYSLTINEYTGYPYMFEKIPERYLPEDYIKQLVVESLPEDYIKQLVVESLPEDYIKQLIEEVINAGGGIDSEDGLLDSNGNYLYDVSNRRLIAKE